MKRILNSFWNKIVSTLTIERVCIDSVYDTTKILLALFVILTIPIFGTLWCYLRYYSYSRDTLTALRIWVVVSFIIQFEVIYLILQ